MNAVETTGQDYNVEGSFNTVLDLMKYFSTADRPMSGNEFYTFWDSLSYPERDYYMHAELS